MTIDEAIKNLEYGTKQLEMEIESGLWIKGSESELCCKKGIALNKQHIEWLTELKDLREENKVLMQECDRLIKEKGELLSKVSGGDVLRICQLEEQLQVELDNSHCLEIELKEAKRLLKMAVEDFSEIKSYLSEPYSHLCDKWRYADEAEKLLND